MGNKTKSDILIKNSMFILIKNLFFKRLIILIIIILQSSYSFPREITSNKTIWGIIGVKGNYAFLEGSFNGRDYFTTDEEIIIVPDIKGAVGFGLSIGANFRKFSYDFSYYRSIHRYNYSDANFEGTCTNNIIRFLGIKGYFNPDKWFNPFIDFDISGHWITLEKGAIRSETPENIIPATYGGISMGLGGGISFQAGRNISFDIGTVASWLVGTDIKAKKSKDYEISRFSNLLLNSSFGITWHFR
jgi:hypothetical protein